MIVKTQLAMLAKSKQGKEILWLAKDVIGNVTNCSPGSSDRIV
jgi:hypothetical protein